MAQWARRLGLMPVVAVGLLLVCTVTAVPDATHAAQRLRITILYDNTAFDVRLEADWGFSALIEYGEHTILFDTGNDGPRLLANAERLGVDLSTIEAIVLSHIHGDHVNGLYSVLRTGISPTTYVPYTFPHMFKSYARSKTEVVEVSDAVEIYPGIHLTGVLSGPPDEQALVVETGEGIVVVTGCSHPGIVRIVRRAKTLIDGDVALVMGGFHLMSHSEDEVQQVIEELRALGVRRICPTHCTGEEAIAQFAEAFGADYVQGGVGRVIIFESTPGPD